MKKEIDIRLASHSHENAEWEKILFKFTVFQLLSFNHNGDDFSYPTSSAGVLEAGGNFKGSVSCGREKFAGGLVLNACQLIFSRWRMSVALRNIDIYQAMNAYILNCMK